MTSKFDFDSPKPMRQPAELDSFGRDRFELLSAYLDGEATATERKQVQEWLDTDAEVQQLYRRLMKLRQGMTTLPIPASERSTEEITCRVFQQIRQRQVKRAIVLGGGAIAALFIGVLSGLFPSNPVPSLRLAHETNEPASTTSVASSPAADDTLMIAVNRPVVEIPKAPVAAELGEIDP
jgi:anti-sigma factor RsiW